MALQVAERKELVKKNRAPEKHEQQLSFIVNPGGDDEPDFRTEYFHHGHMDAWKETEDNVIDREAKPSD